MHLNTPHPHPPRRRYRILGSLVLGVLLQTATTPVAANETPPPKVAALAADLARAQQAGLAEHETWLRLGHWNRRGWDRWLSEVDGPAFFLSASGPRDPAAELRATLTAFYREPVTTVADDHPRCRFPARFLWLRLQGLLAQGKHLPQPECAKLVDYWRRTEATGASVVFSSYYLNNPASAFGHTFLRLHRPGRHGGERQELLDAGIDFSADTQGEGALAYAIYGLTGHYRGTFKLMPYYYKVREYNDFESRDLWSYELDLSPAQLDLLRAHLWELGDTWFDYWYLTENCSYHILGALAVALPGRDLLSGLTQPVIPAETIRVLVEAGLIRDVRWRPSLHSRFEASVAAVDRRDHATVRQLADPSRGSTTALPTELPAERERSARILDAALDLLDLRYAEDVVLRPQSPAAERRQILLATRAGLGAVAAAPEPQRPEHEAPHLGHRSWRAGFGAGWGQTDGSYGVLHARAALHDLADPAPGYPALSTIEFLPLRLHVIDKEPYLRIEQFDLVRVLSLNALKPFHLQPSWTVRGGRVTLRESGCAPCGVGRLQGGTGFTLSWFTDNLVFYLMAEARLLAGDNLRDLDPNSPIVRGGLGPTGGLRLRFGERIALWVEAEHWEYPGQHPQRSTNVEGRLRIVPWPDWGFEFRGSHQPAGSTVGAEAIVYF